MGSATPSPWKQNVLPLAPFPPGGEAAFAMALILTREPFPKRLPCRLYSAHHQHLDRCGLVPGAQAGEVDAGGGADSVVAAAVPRDDVRARLHAPIDEQAHATTENVNDFQGDPGLLRQVEANVCRWVE